MGDENPLRVERVESNKHIREQSEEPTNKKKKLNSMVSAAFSSLLKKVLIRISEGRIKENTRTYGTSIYSEVKQLRACFQQLQEEDHAKDSTFTQKFSECWNRFFSEFMHLSPREPAYQKIDLFIKLLNSFPSPDEHALGFYLTHYAGEEWLPFPYLEILKKLHRDFLTQKEKSDLHIFINKLTQILGDA